MDDRTFIERIRTGGSLMQKTIAWFYHEHFSLVYKKTASHQLDKDQAIDAYSDAVTALVENIRENRFRGESKCSTYFIRIFNNKCIDLIRKNTTNKIFRNSVSLEDFRQDVSQEETTADELTDVGDFFDRLSDICRNVLMDWSDGFSMEDIAAKNGLKNAHTARSKRYNCLQQLMDLLREHPNMKELIK
jgi:RNA polymerase sigma-70 factor (ECF subfamily)